LNDALKDKTGIARGTPEFRKASFALFLAGFATFAVLYTVQPLLPIFAQEFVVSPAESSLALSLSTASLALAILLAAILSEGVGRRGLMFVSMIAASIATLAAAIAPDWHMLLALRTITGFLLGGVPAIAMTWLAEEMEPRSMAHTMGLYVAGTAFGGMSGRVGTGILAEHFGWRWAMGATGFICLLAALGFIFLLPRSRHFARSAQTGLRFHMQAFKSHLTSKGLPFVYLIAFTGMGSFITIFNYVSFRLVDAPYALSQGAIGLIFLVYIFGIASSSFAGPLVERFGRRRILPAGLALMMSGIALTLASPLPLVIGGIVILALGFFLSHSIASSTIGLLAHDAKGHASSLYHLIYYIGSSLAGWMGGWFYAAGHWPAVVAFTLVMLTAAFVSALRINKLVS
jgi:YNFM family putative membrane transporter